VKYIVQSFVLYIHMCVMFSENVPYGNMWVKGGGGLTGLTGNFVLILNKFDVIKSRQLQCRDYNIATVRIYPIIQSSLVRINRTIPVTGAGEQIFDRPHCTHK
jgi:hypothetical protein